MKTALLALAVLVPALACADDPKPYVLHNGLALAADAAAAKAQSNVAPGAARPEAPAAFAGTPAAAPFAARSSSRGGSSGGRAFRGTSHFRGRRGVTGSAPTTGGTPAGGSTPGGGTGGTTPAPDSPPAWATPGAMIRTMGQPPVYSDPGNAGTHSIEGGSFIALDQKRAQDVGRGPGVTWAAPDTRPGTNTGSGGGSAVTANGPGPETSAYTAPRTASKTETATGTGFDPSF